jgi:MoaA/NifB/PqqE/SkfB family radical SAM enzyme
LLVEDGLKNATIQHLRLPPRDRKEGNVYLASRLVPVVCDVSVTNACNATCSFCSYARDKQIVQDRRWLDRAGFARALPILHRRGVRYLTFQGGEPLLHPEIAGLVADTRAAGVHPGLITNGWLLPASAPCWCPLTPIRWWSTSATAACRA